MRSLIIISLALAMSLAGCGGPSETNHLASAVMMKQDDRAAPETSPEFKSEISKLASEGLVLKEALEAGLSEGAHHLAAIFERADSKGSDEPYEFRIIESDGQKTRTIFRRGEFFFSFAGLGKLANLNATDINGDGLKEILVLSSSGGNCWSCNPIEIYQIKDHKVALIAAGPIQEIADINGNNVAELFVTDARWEVYNDLSHAASPTALMVYVWRNDRYVYASRAFPGFYDAEIERLHTAIKEARAEITTEDFSDESYKGLVMSLAITYAHMGNLERGLNELEELMNQDVKSPAQKKLRAAIVADFRSGESYKKLTQMKYGDPML